MPISPQQVAPPIDALKMQQFYQVVDNMLQNAQQVSDAIVKVGDEYYRDDAFSILLHLPSWRLNASEQEKLSRDYLLAGWKECRVVLDGVEPGRGAYTDLLLRSIPQAAPK